MRSERNVLAVILSLGLVFLAACEGGGDGDDGVGGGGGGGGGGGERTQVVETTFVATEGALGLPGAMIELSVDAAMEATRQNGADAFTGTLVEASAGTFQYSPQPANLLRLERLDGRSWDFTSRTLQGDFSGDGARYFRNPHAVDMDVSSNAAAGDLSLTIAAQPVGNEQQGSVRGAFNGQDGTRWDIDLAYQTEDRTDVDFGGNEKESIVQVQGTASASSLGVSIDLDRYYRYILVNVVENIDHRMDHTLTWNGESLRLVGRVFVGLRESQPVDKDQWVIDGQLLRDDSPLLVFTPEEDPTGLRVWLGSESDGFKLFSFSYL